VKTTEVGVVCSSSFCKKVRGKGAKPWRCCNQCGSPVCFNCRGSHIPEEEILCNACDKIAYEQKVALRKATPVECKGCKANVLPDETKTHYFLGTHGFQLCKSCIQVVENVRDFEAKESRKLKAQPGLVEVTYGICQPKEDGGTGYAYRKGNLDLQLGDIVLLPPTCLDREINGKYDNHEGTVVSTYSDYSGIASSIVGLVRKAQNG